MTRQTEKSGKTYSKEMTFEDMAEYASKQIIKGNYKKGYRDGVILVPIKKSLTDNFICPIVKIDENTKLIAEYKKEEKMRNLILKFQL